jgi:predicted methyltransferase
MFMTFARGRVALLALAAATALAGCAREEPAEPAAAAEAPAAAPAAARDAAAPDYAAIVADPSRMAEDAAVDGARKPAEVLAFTRVKPGDVVLEMEAGGGYFTDLLAAAVGPSGRVYMQSPPEFETFYALPLAERFIDGGPPNVLRSVTAFDALEPASGSVDLVTWFLGPHELYFRPENAPDGLGDPATAYAEAFRVLKPGAAFVVIDHAAAAGAPTSTGHDLHRIDPAVVRELAAAAGFTLEEESDLLANPEDDHALSVFDPAIRGRTDQFMFRFVKPA